MKDFRSASDVWEGGFVSPTLEELIEACDDFMGGVWKGESCGEWEADTVGNLKKNFNTEYEYYEEHGDTPTEAVAKLWLTLKENKLV